LDHHINISQLFHLCEQNSPAEYLKGRGLLFERWFFEYGPRLLVKKLHQQIQHNNIIDGTMIDNIQKKTAPSFYVYVIKSCFDINPRHYIQVYYFTLMLDWKGLALTGINGLSYTSLTLSEYVYNNLKQQHIPLKILLQSIRKYSWRCLVRV
jgi:hypothetical protein